MKICYKILLLALCFLLVLPIVYGAPPATTIIQESNNGWEIRSAMPNVIKRGVDFDIHAHIFDIATGNPINTNATCHLNIYNTNGTHLIILEDDTADIYDYDFSIDKKNLTQLGEHPYILQCNGTHNGTFEGGFFSSEFWITETGVLDDGIEIFALAFIFLVMAILFIIGGVFLIYHKK